MASSAANPSVTRLSLDGVPERDRVGVYREVLGRQMMRMEVEPLAGSPLLIDLVFTTLPGLRIASGLVGATENRRTPDLMDSGPDDVAFSILDGAARRSVTKGGETIVESGDGLVSGPDQPFTTTTLSPARILRLQVPRAALSAVAGSLHDLAMRPIRRDSQPLRLLRGYLKVLEDEAMLTSPELRHAVVAHIHDLIVLTIGADRDGAMLASDRGLAAARLHAMKEDIVANLTNEDVSSEAVAARHGMSARHAQRLFETEGTTLSAFVLSQRLARAHRLLGDPLRAHLAISTIAYDCGFGDLSHFNRVFRRRYLATPTDVRAAARAESESVFA